MRGPWVSNSPGRPAARVAAGIFLARVLGLIRERVFAFYFGAGTEADAYRAALKIPNVIRNLLGEGTLSASFIPVYATPSAASRKGLVSNAPEPQEMNRPEVEWLKSH